MKNQDKRIYRSKFNYRMKEPIRYKDMLVFVPDEVLCDPVRYVDNQEEFPAHQLATDEEATYKGVRQANAITSKWLRVRLERDPNDALHFILRPRHSRELVEPRYWEIRVRIEDLQIGEQELTVYVTRCTFARFKGQVWPAWDKKLCTPGLAVDLRPTKMLRRGEILAWKDEWNEQLRVSIHEADEAKLPKVISIEKLRWGTPSTVKAWAESDESIEGL